MIVTSQRKGRNVVFGFEPEAGDRDVARNSQLIGREMRVQVCHDQDVHPDLLALSALLCTQPWAKSISTSLGVSPLFAEAVRSGLGIGIGPVQADLSPRAAPLAGRPGLAYSGGVDCTAALAVMPESTAAYFLERVTPPGGSWVGAYRKDAALHSCAELRKTGALVRRAESDLEFLRTPHGFPHDLANAIPAILHADADMLDSVSWGAILESTYRIGGLTFGDYEAGPFVKQFGPAFAAAGIPVYNPVAGVSEVGTAMISKRSPYGAFAQSCIRGTVGQPCRRCWKCARKILLDSALSGSWPRESEIRQMLIKRNTPGYLCKEPLKHEGVVAYLAARYPSRSSSDLLALLADRVAGYDVDWLARWYVPSLDTAPKQYRDITAAVLDRYLDRMTADDEAALTSWNLGPLIDSDRRRHATTAFLTALQRHLPAPATNA